MIYPNIYNQSCIQYCNSEVPSQLNSLIYHVMLIDSPLYLIYIYFHLESAFVKAWFYNETSWWSNPCKFLTIKLSLLITLKTHTFLCEYQVVVRRGWTPLFIISFLWLLILNKGHWRYWRASGICMTYKKAVFVLDCIFTFCRHQYAVVVMRFETSCFILLFHNLLVMSVCYVYWWFRDISSNHFYLNGEIQMLH